MENKLEYKYIFSTALGASAAIAPVGAVFSFLFPESQFSIISPASTLGILGLYAASAAYSSKEFFNQAKYTYNTSAEITSFSLKVSALTMAITYAQDLSKAAKYAAGMFISGLAYDFIVKPVTNSIANDIYYANHYEDAKIDTMGAYESGYYIDNPLYI